MDRIKCSKCFKVYYLRPHCWEFVLAEKQLCECGNDLNSSGGSLEVFEKEQIEIWLDDNYNKKSIYGLFFEDFEDFGLNQDEVISSVEAGNIEIQNRDVEGNMTNFQYIGVDDVLKIINRETPNFINC